MHRKENTPFSTPGSPLNGSTPIYSLGKISAGTEPGTGRSLTAKRERSPRSFPNRKRVVVWLFIRQRYKVYVAGIETKSIQCLLEPFTVFKPSFVRLDLSIMFASLDIRKLSTKPKFSFKVLQRNRDPCNTYKSKVSPNSFFMTCIWNENLMRKSFPGLLENWISL